MDPAVTARAWRRWNTMLTVGGLTFGIAIGTVLLAAALIAMATGTDPGVLGVTLAVVLLGVLGVAALVFAALRAVLGRRGVWGPPPSWGADRRTRRRIAAALRTGSRPRAGPDDIDETAAHLAAAEAEHIRRLGLLPPSAWLVATAGQIGALLLVAPSGQNAPVSVTLGLLLLGLRLAAVAFCTVGCYVALVALARARRYMRNLAVR